MKKTFKQMADQLERIYKLYSRLYHRISTIVLDAYKDNSEALSYFYATLD